MNEYPLGYRKYNSEVPSFLVNRPRILIFTAKDIEGQLIECNDITKGSIKSKTQSQDGCRCLSSFGDSVTMCRCECPDWKERWLLWKHYIAIFNTYPAWQWENLSSVYLDCSFFSLDEGLITKIQSVVKMKKLTNSTGKSNQSSRSVSTDRVIASESSPGINEPTV